MKHPIALLLVPILLTACSGLGSNGGTISGGSKNPPYFRITSPKAAETFCMGEDALIAWEGDSSIQTVSLELKNPGTYRKIDDFPLNFKDGMQQGNKGKGEYRWPAGSVKGTSPLGEGYAFQIQAAVRYKKGSKRGAFTYVSDAIFSIVNCN